jgi:hypothetical protein
MSQNVHEEFSRRVDGFKDRIGFSKLKQVTGPDGVLAMWEDLQKTLSLQLKPMRLESTDGSATESGMGEAEWIWKGGQSSIDVSIFVSGAGPAKAQRQLLSIASATTMVRIPYESGPPGLGDLSIHNPRYPAAGVIWVYKNVCVQVDNDGSDVDVEPIARAVQKFMEAHRVARLAEHLPRVERVDVSAKQIHVGEEWRVSFELGKNTPMESVLTEIDEEWQSLEYGWHPRLEALKHSPLGAVYRGVEPGTARVQIRVVDRRTLLSPPLSVTVDVLPAR